jgi:2-polyprenyl-3-methyl-5-hydroxy-6-metoxy-1,4-benzoquinol methylase
MSIHVAREGDYHARDVNNDLVSSIDASYLGRAVWDIILVSHLVHHLSDAQNRSLIRRAADGLRPNGIVVVLDVLRDSSGEVGSQIGTLLDLYFAMTSLSGTFSVEQITSWLSPTRLGIERIIPLRSAPGISLVVARKAADSTG